MTDDDSNILGAAGYIVIFSFVSIVLIFIAMLFIGSINNYALGDLIGITNLYDAMGLIPAGYGDLAQSTAETYIEIIPYLDIMWFSGFISLFISSMIFSYNRRKENYFSLFTMSVLGIIILTYVGGFVIQLTDWFKIEILFSVFPDLPGLIPLFSWYLENLGVLNLVIIVLNILANYVNLDFSKYFKKKEGESFDEV